MKTASLVTSIAAVAITGSATVKTAAIIITLEMMAVAIADCFRHRRPLGAYAAIASAPLRRSLIRTDRR